MKLRFLQREEIEEPRWNGCVHYAHNSLPYGYTWYLDNTAREWGGIVEGNYESVMPLPFARNMMHYQRLAQPLFCQQLGLFSVNVLNTARISKFLEAIPNQFRFIKIHGNEKMSNIEFAAEKFTSTPKVNMLLDLKADYEAIRKGYSKNLKRNLKQVAKHSLFMSNDLTPEKAVELFKVNQGHKDPNITETFYHTCTRIIYNAMHRGMGSVSGVFDEYKNLLASNFFLYGKNRIISMLPALSPEGRKCMAMPHLMDVVIRNNAGRPMFLDFEGSSIENIARFNRSFGAEEVYFPTLEKNTLPLPLKWMSK